MREPDTDGMRTPPQHTRSAGEQRRRERTTGLVILLGVVLVLLAGEGWFRLAEPQVIFRALFEFAPDGRPWRLAPGARAGRLSINEQGFRGSPVEVPAPPGTLRIAFLGTSATFDPNGGDAAQAWPALTTARLARRVSGCRVDHVNAGHPGFGTAALTRVLRDAVAPLTPDVLVLTPTDFLVDAAVLAAERGFAELIDASGALSAHSLLAFKLERAAIVARLLRGESDPRGKLQPDIGAMVREYRVRLLALLREARRIAPLVIVVPQQMKLRRGQSRPQQLAAFSRGIRVYHYLQVADVLAGMEAYAATARSVTADLGVPYLEPKRPVPDDSQHFWDMLHFTVAGSEVAAADLASGLLAEPGFVALLRERGCVLQGAGA